jgi:hypothetical protein
MSVDQKVSDRKARRQKKKQTFFSSSSSSNKTDLKIENNRNPVKKTFDTTPDGTAPSRIQASVVYFMKRNNLCSQKHLKIGIGNA